MRKKPYTVNEEDYKLLQRLKTISKENKQRLRLLSIKTNKTKIKQKQREIDFKQKQLKEEKCVEKHESFVDGVKPLFMLKSDIENIEAEIEQFEEESKYAQEEYDKEVK